MTGAMNCVSSPMQGKLDAEQRSYAMTDTDEVLTLSVVFTMRMQHYI